MMRMLLPSPHTSGRTVNVSLTVPSRTAAMRWARGAPRDGRSGWASAGDAPNSRAAAVRERSDPRIGVTSSLVQQVLDQLRRARILRARDPEDRVLAHLGVLLV